VLTGYHRPAADQIIFDSNRLWTGKLPILRALYPQARVICCVRPVGWIIDSVERLLRANPLEQSRLFGGVTGSVYQRANILLNAEAGLIGQPWSMLREAWFSDFAPGLIIIDYDRLTANPKAIIAALYQALGEPAFAHDFDNLAFDTPDYDAHLGLPGLHHVRPKLALEKRQLSIPPDLFAQHEEANFWRRSELNQHGATVL
jgi:sulfotransferase